jgi:hypothetical protein
MDRKGTRHLRALACGLAVATLVVWASQAAAYPSYDDGSPSHIGCVSCHFNGSSTGGFTGGPGVGTLHNDHLTTFGITSCTLCHDTVGGDLPVLTYRSGDGFGCSGCHGNDTYGETSVLDGMLKASGYGLRRKHDLLGVTVCATCHYPGSSTTGEPDPAPAIVAENVPPPYYGRSTNNLTDPCSTAQESFDNTVGLDNDGNGLADAADSACAAFVTTTTVNTSTTTSTTLFVGTARRITVYPGQSIQDAVDAIAPGGTVYVMPGTYQEVHGGSNAVTVQKNGVRLIARSKPRHGVKVTLLAYPGQHSGIVVQPAIPTDRIDGLVIKGFTVQGFPNNGIFTRNVDNFRIEENESIDNLENGIWPTLSANGLVKKNVSYGSQDSAMWVEGSENVRVIRNELHDSPTGLEITVSKNIRATRNDVHDNTIGVGLYHPNAAGLPPLGGDGDWTITRNHVHHNNKPNSAPPGSMSAGLPPGGGILVLGVDRVNVLENRVDNNSFFGIAVIDWCLAVGGSDFDCVHRPPVVEPVPDNDTFVSNILTTNGTNPIPFGGFEFFAADLTYLVLPPSTGNCFAKNTYTTIQGFPPFPLQKTCN